MAKAQESCWTYQKNFRLHYAQCLGWLALLFFASDQFCSLVGISDKVFDSADGTALRHVFCGAIWWLSCANIAGAQMSEGGQRLLLQATGVASLFVLISMAYKQGHQTQQGMQFLVGTQVLTLAMLAYNVWGKNKPLKNENAKGTSRVTNVLRFAGVQQLGWGLGWFFKGEDVMTMVGGKLEEGAAELVGTWIGAVVFGVAVCTFVVSEKCNEADQRKWTQYAIAGACVWPVVFTASWGDMQLTGTSLQMTQFQYLQCMLNLMLLMWAIYPASYKTWFLRWCYVQWLSATWMLSNNSDLMFKMGEMSVMSHESAAIVSSLALMLAMWAVVAAQCDDDTQEKLLRYMAIGNVFGIYLHLSGKVNFGMWFPQNVVISLVQGLWFACPQAFDFLDNSGKKRAMSTSPKRRNRSQTPKMKRSSR